jgi:hypothetical protein
MLLEAKLGMCVQVLPPGGHFAVKQIDEMWDLHGEPLHEQTYRFYAPTLGEAQKQATIGRRRQAEIIHLMTVILLLAYNASFAHWLIRRGIACGGSSSVFSVAWRWHGR